MHADEITRALSRDGFVFLPASDVGRRLGPLAEAERRAFAASWDDLGEDLYMADGGRYRRRRHAVFELSDAPKRLPAQPHYQSRDYNPLNGGVARWFAPVTDEVANSAVLSSVVALARDLIALELSGKTPPLVMEMHQFRIEARNDAAGRPTPEGLHRDGVDWVFVMLVKRENVLEGETQLAGPDREPLGAFTLSQPFDMVFLDDWRVFHGVTPIRPEDPTRPGARDVLVLTFRKDEKPPL